LVVGRCLWYSYVVQFVFVRRLLFFLFFFKQKTAYEI